MAFSTEQAFSLMKAAHERGRLAHAFLVSGPRGSGKERLAARVVQMLEEGANGGGGFDLFGEPVVPPEPPPLDEMAGEWLQVVRPQSKSRRISVDHIREMEKRLYVVSGPQRWKVAVLVDADRMGEGAANAFLKTLEEPPARTLLLLLTTNPGGLLPTILSRCVRMPLIGQVNLLEDGGEELLRGLAAAAERGWGREEVALGLKAIFAGLLEQKKAEAYEAGEEQLKQEEKVLKQAIEGDYLKRREEFLKAVAEAEYLAARARLFEVLQAWMADILRCKAGAGGLDFPESEEILKRLAAAEPMEGLLRRMDALGRMRGLLETNAQEALVLEVGFLQAFA